MDSEKLVVQQQFISIQNEAPMQTDCNPKLFAFEAVERKSVVAAFDGGALTSDAGGLLLGAADRRINLVGRLAGCL